MVLHHVANMARLFLITGQNLASRTTPIAWTTCVTLLVLLKMRDIIAKRDSQARLQVGCTTLWPPRNSLSPLTPRAVTVFAPPMISSCDQSRGGSLSIMKSISSVFTNPFLCCLLQSRRHTAHITRSRRSPMRTLKMKEPPDNCLLANLGWMPMHRLCSNWWILRTASSLYGWRQLAEAVYVSVLWTEKQNGKKGRRPESISVHLPCENNLRNCGIVFEATPSFPLIRSHRSGRFAIYEQNNILVQVHDDLL
jgi:hypothetical protein